MGWDTLDRFILCPSSPACERGQPCHFQRSAAFLQRLITVTRVAKLALIAAENNSC